MKKFLIASGVAVLAFASVAAAQTFNANLTVGSTGSDVVALQTALINGGYSIPAIASGAAAKGYFGSQTKSAVMAYQSAHGVPNTGFVGPLTRAALNGGAAVTPVATGCPAGYTCTANPGTPTTPVYNTPGSITTPGVAGTLAFSLQSTPSNGTSLDKGQSADVVRYKLQAGASDMSVSSLALDFDKRLWLTIGSITVKDDSGAVIAQKSGLTQNDFTELTVGTSYRLYVPVSNYIVPKAATRYFTINLTALGITDQSAATVTIAKAQIRSVDGTGVTDTQTEDSDRTYAFTGSNNGQIVVTLDSSSPLKKLVQISTSAETDLVPVAVYSVKSQNKDATLRTFKVTVQTNMIGVTNLFTDIKIKAGGLTYSADSVGSTTSFTNLQIPLPKDQYVPVTVYVKVAKDTSNVLDGASASTTLTVNTTNVVAEDSTFNTVSTNSVTLSSSDAIFSASSAVLSGLSATLGAPVVNSNTTTAYPVSFKFTLTAGDNSLYVSTAPGVALGTTTTGYTSNAASNASTTLTDVIANPGTLSGDASGYYVVPAGSSRDFTYNGTIKYEAANPGLKTFKISTVYYGTLSSALTANNITYNLESLKVAPVF